MVIITFNIHAESILQTKNLTELTLYTSIIYTLQKLQVY